MEKEVVIVTGSCGWIGTNVVRRLGERYRVVGFELLKALYASPNEELVPVDLSSDESVHQAFTHVQNFYGKKIASIIHLAAYYSFEQQHSDLYEKVTVQGTERLLKAIKEFNFEVEQILFSSSMLVHAPCELGQKITEESPLDPKWDYPLSKVKTEKAIHNLRGNTKSVIMRIAGVYNDHCHSIPISHQIQRIYENSFEKRLFSGNIKHGATFVHMDDLIDAIELAVNKRHELPSESTLLIGEPNTMSYDDLQRTISRLLTGKEFTTIRIPKPIAKIGAWVQCHIPFIPKPFIKPWLIDLADDHYQMDISKAKQLLNWTPQHSIQKTLPKMIEFLKKDPVRWYKENHLKFPPLKKGH